MGPVSSCRLQIRFLRCEIPGRLSGQRENGVAVAEVLLVRQQVASSGNPRCASFPSGFLKSSSCKREGPRERDKEPFGVPTALAVASNLYCLNKSPLVLGNEARRDVLMARAFQLSVQKCHCRSAVRGWMGSEGSRTVLCVDEFSFSYGSQQGRLSGDHQLAGAHTEAPSACPS